MLACGYIYVTLLYRFYRDDELQYMNTGTWGPTGRRTHNPDRIEQTIFYETLLQAALVAPLLAVVAIAHRAPRRADACTATREKKVVVQLILRLRWPAAADWPHDRGALDGDDDGEVIWRGEDVPAEAVCACVWFLAE